MAKIIGYINRYQGKEDKIWSGRTIFSSLDEAKSVPCANKDSYIDTCALYMVNNDETNCNP